MEFYAGTLQRRRMQEFTRSEPPAPCVLEEPPLPVDAADGGCDDLPQCETPKAWSRETPLLTVAPEHGITDRGEEVYNALRARGLTTVLVMGVHSNMYILNRTFALRQMTAGGVPCVLVRDLTDTMYNPRQKPFVPHDEGTELVIRHIERYLASSTTSKELLAWLSSR